MSVDELRDLKHSFLGEYGYAADRRAHDATWRHSVFVVDDRRSGSADFRADGQLEGWFCEVIAEIGSPVDVLVTLRGGIPIGVKVKAWMAAHGERIDKEAHGFRDAVSFEVTPSDAGKLLTLADAIESVVAPGTRYSDPTWKSVCPRTANTLRRLHSTLARAWGRWPV